MGSTKQNEKTGKHEKPGKQQNSPVRVMAPQRKNKNRNLILSVVKSNPSSTVHRISLLSKLSYSTTENYVKSLLSEGSLVIIENGVQKNIFHKNFFKGVSNEN